MNLIQIDYKTKPNVNTNFIYCVFGRLSIIRGRVHKGRYLPGLLHNIPYFKEGDRRFYTIPDVDVDYSDAMKYCEKFEISSVVKDDADIHLRTPYQRFKFHAEENGLKFEDGKHRDN